MFFRSGRDGKAAGARRPGRIALVVIAGLMGLPLAAPAHADAGFRKFLSDFYQVAAKSGVTRQTYEAVFRGINEPDPVVLERARYQPEFTSQVWDYLDGRVTEDNIRNGQKLRAEYDRWLDIIESRFGVDRDILLAIWAIESLYGEYLTRPNSLHHVGQALATLAYADKRRAKFARQQLVAALKIVQNGDITPDGLRGSWAGAMGHTQFIPTSYEAWAVDIDGNGRRDVWNSVPDALASAANLLKRNGWVPGRTWGYEVVLPRGFNTSLADKDGYTIRDFERMGVKRPGGRPFTGTGDNAVLKLFAGPEGPAFLMLRNFYILKRYNNADTYALAVGHLADRIAGFGPIVQPWPRGYTPLDEAGRKALQVLLTRSGHYDGEIDGRIGPMSRRAIIDWQRANGLKPDGNPSQELLTRMRRS